MRTLDVGLKGGGPVEAHATLITLVWTLASVCLQMVGECRLALVGAATVLAEVLTFVQVYLFVVVPEEGVGDELLAAGSTQVCLGVLVVAHLTMTQQTGVHEEHLTALIARELHSTGVYVHVHVDMHKVLFAYRTHVLGCVLVVVSVAAGHVLVEQDVVGQTLVTIVTLELDAVLQQIGVCGAAVVQVLAVRGQACIAVLTVNCRHISVGAQEVLLHVLPLTESQFTHGTPAITRLVTLPVDL